MVLELTNNCFQAAIEINTFLERGKMDSRKTIGGKCVSIIDHVGQKAGMDCYSGSLAKGFAKLGCRVLVCSNFSGQRNGQVEYKCVFDDHNTKSAPLKFLSFLNSMVLSCYYARKNKVKIVILHLFSTNWLSFIQMSIPKFFGLKLAVIAHDVTSFRSDDSKCLQKLIYNKLSDYIVVHNIYSLQVLKNSVPECDECKLNMIKHGGYSDYVPANVDRSSACRFLGLDRDRKYLLFFGQIKKVKGLDLLLDALAQVNEDVSLIIAGKPWGDDFSKYEAKITSSGLEDRVVKMIRYISDEERDMLFMAADVNVLPYREIFQSGVLLMAMSFGLPVIASDLPANKEVIFHQKNGLLFKSENDVDLANQINLFFSDTLLAENMAKKAKITIENEYCWDDIAKEYLIMFESDF